MSTTALVALTAVCAGSAAAQSWNGSASTDWTNAANWTGGVPTTGTATIETASPNPTVIGIGVGGAANTTSGQFYVGRNSGGNGNLTIQNGSTLTGSNYARVGENAGSSGVVTVTGAGSTWVINNVTVPGLIVGNFGTGRLDITNGGAVVTDAIYIGRANTGVLNITGGGTLTSTGSAVPSLLGRDAAGNALVTVSGAGSAWTLGGTSNLVVGSSGTATLNIQNGGEVISTNGIKVGDITGSSGVINLTSGGTLETLNLDGTGAGAKQLNFDNGILRANANNASFISGFTGTQLNLQSGGLTLDTQGFNVTAASPFSGAGGLTKIGTGTLTLTGANTYSGQTWIQSGTLALSGSGALENSNRVVADGTFDISAVTPTSASIQSLAGGGSVVLGAKTLTLTNANDTFAGSITGSGGLTVSGGTQVLSGTNAFLGGTTINAGTLSVSSDGNLGDAAGALTFNGGALQNTAAFSSARNVTIDAGGGAFQTNADLTWSGVISGTGELTKSGGAMLTLTGDSSGFTGGTSVESGTLVVNGKLCGDVNVASGGRLQGTGTVCDTTNAGTVAPGNSIGTLTVAGDYAGTGGSLEMEVASLATGSAADRLVITGNVTGTTNVNVVNLGGTSALTGTTNTDGISLVQIGGTSTASAFQLPGGYAAAGPYQYRLNAFAPGASAAGEADALLGTTNFWDYRLQSLVDASGNPVPVPQIAAYQGLPSGALRYGSATLDSLHKRLGEIHHLTDYRANDVSKQTTGEFFLRGQGSRSDVSGEDGPDYDQDIWFTQFGGNVLGWDIGDKGASLRVGAAISVGGSNLDVKTSSAEVDLNATSFALTSTYQAAQGWYLDAVAQASRYTTDVTTAERGQVGNPDGWGWGASLEGGYPINLGNKLILEPQAQLAYQQVKFDSFTDVDDIRVDLQGGESLRGRLGGRVQKTFSSALDGDTALWSPYLEVNALHEFLDGDGITASGVTFQSDNGGTSLQFGTGLNAQLTANAAVFANISYEKGISDGTADTWTGTVGLRMDF